MARAVLSCSSLSEAATAALLLLLVGCSARAPALPPDTTSVNRGRSLTLEQFSEQDRALDCDQIGNERRQLAESMNTANGAIEANRGRNQVAGYFGALFLVPWLATDSNSAEKAQLTELYKRQDTLIQLAAVKHCPASP